MAIETICNTLANGLDLSCSKPDSKYEQEIVIIPYSFIDQSSVVAPWVNEDPEQPCDYTAQFELKPGKTGYRFSLPRKGSGVFATTDYSTSDNGYTQYSHNINFMMTSTKAEDKCTLDALMKDRVVVATQMQGSGIVEIHGLRYGLYLADGSLDIQSGGGVSAVILSSREDALESHLPLVYQSTPAGQEEEDFDTAFANTGS